MRTSLAIVLLAGGAAIATAQAQPQPSPGELAKTYYAANLKICDEHKECAPERERGDVLANYILRNLATGEIADGSNARGYPTDMAIFQALCPKTAPAAG